MFFGWVAGEFAVLPNAGEFFEFVGCHLVIGRIAGLFFVVEHGRAADGATARAKHFLWIFFFGPPENLVEPMDAPIAEGPVGVIQKIAPAARMKLAVERTQRGGTAPLVPIHTFWRGGVGQRFF